MDCHEELGTSISSGIEEISKQYRKLALKHHPHKSSTQESESIFANISEAYQVLSDKPSRAIYEQFGLEGLRNGVPAHPGFDGYSGGWKAPKKPLELFEWFFGGSNPYSDFYCYEYVPEDKGPAILNQSTATTKIVSQIPVTLSELYTGTLKICKVAIDGTEHDLRVDIGKGWKNGMKIIRNEKSTQIEFIIVQDHHDTFVRQNNNLILIKKVTLLEALVGITIQLKTLDGRLLRIPITQVVFPGYEQVIAGEGMSIDGELEKKGDLILRFQLEFPTYLSPVQRSNLKKALVK